MLDVEKRNPETCMCISPSGTDAMNPLKNPAVLISPAAGVTKAVSNILKNK